MLPNTNSQSDRMYLNIYSCIMHLIGWWRMMLFKTSKSKVRVGKSKIKVRNLNLMVKLLRLRVKKTLELNLNMQKKWIGVELQKWMLKRRKMIWIMTIWKLRKNLIINWNPHSQNGKYNLMHQQNRSSQKRWRPIQLTSHSWNNHLWLQNVVSDLCICKICLFIF